MTSVLNVDTIAAKNGTSPVALTKQLAAKARVRYDQVAATLKDSENVSSYTDTAGGQSTIALTNSMSDALYNAITDGTRNDPESAYDQTHSESFTSSQFVVRTGVYSTGAITTDFDLGQAVVFGDLA